MGVATLSAPARKRVVNRKERRELKHIMAVELREHRADQEEELELFKRDQARQRAQLEKEQTQARLKREQEIDEFSEFMSRELMEFSMQVTFEIERRKLIFEGISSITDLPLDDLSAFNREVTATVKHLGPLKAVERVALTRTIERISEREVEASEKKAAKMKSAIAVG